MKYLRWALPLLLFSFVLTVPVHSQSLYGTLSNFDVFNDTGQDCHGFEIELDGLTSKDVLYEFAAPNSQYPAPKLRDFSGGVYVDYESPYDPVKGWAKTTPVPLIVTPTAGHACWVSGVGVNGDKTYPNTGCEHFGLSLARNPTSVHYRWLVAGLTPGTLTTTGHDVVLPAPVWTVVLPQQPPPGQPPQPVVIKAVAPPPPEIAVPETEPQYGEAVWIKRFSVQNPNHAVLNNMVQDGADDVADSDAEDAELVLSQSVPAGEKDVEKDSDLVAGKNAIVRRYEIYKYLGGYDPDSHEALCDDSAICPEAVGPYLGSQIAAANLIPGTPVDAKVTTTGFVYSRVTKTFVGKVTITNTSGQDVSGPVAIVFRKLPNGATLVNASGNVGTDPYFTFIAAANVFAGGSTKTFYVQFQSPTGITFIPAVYSGSLQ